MEDHEAELDAIAAELETAGLMTVTTDEQGSTIYALTREGAAVGRRLAMPEDADECQAYMDEVLDT